MKSTKLDKSEKALLADFESGQFRTVLTPARKNSIRRAAEASVTKDRRINIRISGRDLDAIQRRALEEGIPYQTLVSSVLHKYVSGGLRDVTANKLFKRLS